MADPTRIYPGDTGYVAAVELVAEHARRRITAAVELLDAIPPATDLRTHWPDCHTVHTGCLATRIRRTLTGEDATDAH